tara:strand:- start:93 stop:476 length:384 start_codon:yes stop_codon:yes gene_type:complete
MAFKLGSEVRRTRNSKDTPILRKKLEKGVLGEANMDGSVYVDKSVKPGSALDKRIQRHEGQHAKEMKANKIYYNDNTVVDKIAGITYKRKGGKLIVDESKNAKFKKGDSFEEGSNDLPHEKRAKKAE